MSLAEQYRAEGARIGAASVLLWLLECQFGALPAERVAQVEAGSSATWTPGL